MIGNQTPPSGTAHILVVEDNPINMELVRDILKAYGFQVSEATNGTECQTWLQTHQPDLILMDIQLPGIDGLTLTQHIRNDDRLKHIPVVALTAYAMKGDLERALAAGCTGVITKPIDTRAFPRQVEAYLQGFSEAEKDT
jgi:CheY-like chemotaxis protein